MRFSNSSLNPFKAGIGSLALVLILVALYIVFPHFSTVYGQQGRGTIQGMVTDSASAGIGGAQVTVTNTSTNLSFTTLTAEEGHYTVPNLIVGSYSVAVTKEGFKKSLR